MSTRLVDSVLETFIRKSRWSGPAARYWIGAFWIFALPFLISGRVFRLETEIAGEHVSALCIGRNKRFQDLAQKVFNGAELQPTGARRALWRVSDRSCGDADFVAMETHPWLAAGLRRRGWIIVPEFVRWRGRIAEMPPRPPGGSLSEDLRKLTRHEFTCEAATSREAWDEFLQEIVIPYARYRFGEDAWIPTEAFTRPLPGAHSWILFVRHQGRRVAASCVVLHNNEAWTPLLGVRKEDVALLKHGAMAAVYSFLIAWLRERGAEELDFGRTSSFRRNGLALYKAKWGFCPEAEPLSPLIAMRFRPDRPALREAFERQPVYTLRERNLSVFDGSEMS
jgi:hypothetical protein